MTCHPLFNVHFTPVRLFKYAAITAVTLLAVIQTAVAQDAASLDRLIREARDSFGVPGLAVGVIKDGQIILSKGYGLRQNNGQARVDEHTLFAIASNTKAFVGTMAAMLHVDGKLDLEDRVSTHLPYLKYSDPNVTALANVTDLMTHRIGLGTFEGDHLWFKRGLTPKQVLTKVESMPLRYPFRAGYGYSNLGFIAAGEVISKTAGAPWQDVIRTRIFDRLGMARTTLHTSELEQRGNYASGHITRQGNKAIEAVAWDVPGAAGGIWSSAHDMLRWVQCNLDTGRYGRDTIWTKAVARKVWTPHNTFGSNETFTSYGLGWFMRKVGSHTVLSHGGGYDGMYSQVQLVPEERLGIVVLTNSMTGLSSAVATEIRNQFLGTPREDWLTTAMGRQRRGDAEWFSRQDSVAYYANTPDASRLLTAPQVGAYVDEVFGEFRVAQRADGYVLHFPEAPGLVAKLGTTATPSGSYLIRWEGEPTAWFDKGLAYFTKDADGVTRLRLYIPNDDIFYNWIDAPYTGK